MVLDKEMLKEFYASYGQKVMNAAKVLDRPLTFAEKVLYAHLYDNGELKSFKRGEDYVDFKPDRVAMQDATAQMALLQFMNAGKDRVAVPSSVHCDHLIKADVGVEADLPAARVTNKEVYDFLGSVSKKYGIGFWGPGAGIIHQVWHQCTARTANGTGLLISILKQQIKRKRCFGRSSIYRNGYLILWHDASIIQET